MTVTNDLKGAASTMKRGTEMYPVHAGGPYVRSPPPSQDQPVVFTDTQLAGQVTSLEVDNSGVQFGFTNPFDGVVNYSYEAEFYDSNGTPIAIQDGSGYLIGSDGGVWFSTSDWSGTPYYSVQVMITINTEDGDSGAPGNGTATAP